MFGGFNVLAGLSIKLRPKKKSVVWPLVGMFGGSMSSDFFGGFLDQITTGKNRYRQPADWNGIINKVKKVCYFQLTPPNKMVELKTHKL